MEKSEVGTGLGKKLRSQVLGILVREVLAEEGSRRLIVSIWVVRKRSELCAHT